MTKCEHFDEVGQCDANAEYVFSYSNSVALGDTFACFDHLDEVEAVIDGLVCVGPLGA